MLCPELRPASCCFTNLTLSENWSVYIIDQPDHSFQWRIKFNAMTQCEKCFVHIWLAYNQYHMVSYLWCLQFTSFEDPPPLYRTGSVSLNSQRLDLCTSLSKAVQHQLICTRICHLSRNRCEQKRERCAVLLAKCKDLMEVSGLSRNKPGSYSSTLALPDRCDHSMVGSRAVIARSQYADSFKGGFLLLQDAQWKPESPY